MKFSITNRLSGASQFIAEIDCAEDAPTSTKVGLAVRWAVKTGANLAGANLTRANLARANLAGAYLTGAYLTGANLTGANLARANLARANLAGAYLTGAYLAGADLAGADLAGADLARADLAGADLTGADLAGAKIKDLVVLGHPNGWSAWTYITEAGEQRIQVGCHNKTIAEGRQYWADKENRREVMAVLDYAESIAKIRGWVSEKTETT